MPCFGKTYCYISKTIHSVRVFRHFLWWSRDIPNMGVVRNFWRKHESNKHGKLWCPLDFRNQKKGGFKISVATDLLLSFSPLKFCHRGVHTLRQSCLCLFCHCELARIQTSLNLCDRSQRQNSVTETVIYTCRTRRFVAATCWTLDQVIPVGLGHVLGQTIYSIRAPLHPCVEMGTGTFDARGGDSQVD